MPLNPPPGAGTGDMLAGNNLSELANPETARNNIGLPANIKRVPLRKTTRKIAAMYEGNDANSRVSVLAIGDSLGGWSGYLFRQLIAAHGWAGYFGPVAANNATISGLGFWGGGTAAVSSISDFSVTPTGDYVPLSASGHFAGFGSGANGNANPFLRTATGAKNVNSDAWPICNLAKVIFIGGAGTGQFKVQVSYDGTNYVDVASLAAVDAATYPAGHNTITGAITEGLVVAVRCLWISGTTNIYATGAESTIRSGVILNAFHKGSIQMGPAGFAGGAGAANLLAACAPDLVTFCALDGVVADPTGTGGIVPAMTATYNLLAALASPPDVIFCGVANTSGDLPASTTIYNNAAKAYAVSVGAGFVDPFAVLGTYAVANANGDMADITHWNAAGAAKITQEVIQQYNTLSWVNGSNWLPRQDSTRNLWPGNFGVWPTGTAPAAYSTPATTANNPTPGVSFMLGGTFSGSVTASQVVIPQNESPSNNRYGMRVIQTSSVAGASMVIYAGPARALAGKQVTIRFRAKATSAQTASLFWGRYAGSGLNAFAGNVAINMTSDWKTFMHTVVLPQLNDSESAAGSGTFSLNFPTTAMDFQIADVEIVLGPLPTKQPVQDMAETKTHDFASIAAGAMDSTTIAVFGAQVGQAVDVIRPYNMTQNIVLSAAVTSLGIVTLYAHNPSPGAIDLPSLNYAVRVR